MSESQGQIDCPYSNMETLRLQLGMKPSNPDPRTMMLSSIVEPKASIPKSVDWTPKTPPVPKHLFPTCKKGHTHFAWGGMLNTGQDALNDCTIAAAGHMIQTWTANRKQDPLPQTIPDEVLRDEFGKLTGHVGTEEESTGSTCLDALNHWRKSGVGGHRVLAFFGLRPGNREDLKRTIHMFGGAYVGLRLPKSACKKNLDSRGQIQPWNKETGSEEDGLHHAVCAVKYSSLEVTVVTFGYEQRMTWDFYEKHAVEAYGVLSPDWLRDGQAPNGLDADQLGLHLQALSFFDALHAHEREKNDRTRQRYFLNGLAEGSRHVNDIVSYLKRRPDPMSEPGEFGERVANSMPILLSLARDDREREKLEELIHQIGFDRRDVREEMERRFLHRH